MFLDQTVGIDEIETVSDVNLYPNPTEGGFVITGKELSGQVGVRIINTQGQEVYNELRIARGKLAIDELFDAGVYFIELNIKGNFVRKRIVIL